jgi:hypothetical protein
MMSVGDKSFFHEFSDKDEVFNARREKLASRHLLIIDVRFKDSRVLAARNAGRVFTFDAASVNALYLNSDDRFLIREAWFEQFLSRVK